MRYWKVCVKFIGKCACIVFFILSFSINIHELYTFSFFYEKYKYGGLKISNINFLKKYDTTVEIVWFRVEKQ